MSIAPAPDVPNRKKGDGIVYAIVNALGRATYVGATRVTLRRRCINHMSELSRGCHFAAGLQADWNRLGDSAFSIEILELVDGAVGLFARERYWISTKRDEGWTLYNAEQRRADKREYRARRATSGPDGEG